jgi:hypothetical protein
MWSRPAAATTLVAAMIDVERDPEGGDAACWLGLVCSDCGALHDRAAECRRCGGVDIVEPPA